MEKKKGPLGKGLGSLLRDAVEEQKVVVSAIEELPLENIRRNPFQPREEFDPEALGELAASIKAVGIVQPITVRPVEDGKYEIIAGERRYRASQMAGLKTIPAYIRNTEDDRLLALALIENIQRENLNAIEVAISYQRLLDECKLTQEELSEQVGKNRATVANYLRLILSDSYDVSCCFDADSALRKAKEEMPELILSDVMMPGKDGCELCRELKSNMVLSHIPVILVTAKASVDNQVAGLEAGADAYVTKPFEPKYLHAVIKSQLDKRHSLQEALNTSTSSEAAEHEEALPLQDKAFLSRLYAVMDESLSNSEVDINRIAEIMKISRTNFYYKVKSLTGETPSTFYRNYKFNKAIALMKEGKYNLTEIAFMTGFSSSSQFSTSFKKHFGVSPKEYRQRF